MDRSGGSLVEVLVVVEELMGFFVVAAVVVVATFLVRVVLVELVAAEGSSENADSIHDFIFGFLLCL